MPISWNENPYSIKLEKRPFTPAYSSRDPLGNESSGGNAGDIQFNTTAKSVDEDAGSVDLTIVRVNGSEGEVSVDYSTQDSTAIAGQDYSSTSGTVTFLDGETQKVISVSIIDNSETDGDLSFDVSLSNPTNGASLGSPSTSVVTIRDDESELATGENLLTRIKVENNSGTTSPQDQMYTFGSPIEPGEVSGGRTVELRHNGLSIPYQMDGEVHQHHDGTLNFANFTCQLPSISDGSSEFIELISLDGSKPTGSVDETPLTNADYNLFLDEGGVSYTASLNNAISANQYDVERDGPLAKRYKAHIFFNDGTNDHSQLWARFYATVFSDGTTQIMAQVINGYIEAASNLEYSNLELRSGSTVLRTPLRTWQANSTVFEGSYVVPTSSNGFVYEAQEIGGFSSGITGSSEPSWPTTVGNTVTDGEITWECRNGIEIYNYTVHSLADDDALPYWSSNKPVVHHKLDRGYITKARAWYSYHDLPIGEYNGDLVYSAGGHGEIKYAINSGGDANHIGFLTDWSTKALIAQEAGRDKADRINALSWLDAPFSMYESDGRIPVLTQASFTGDGMNSSRPNDGWYAEVTIPKDSTPWNTVDGTHNPQVSYYQTLKTGDEWFRDICLVQANNSVGVGKQGSGPGYPGWQRRIEKEDGSGEYWDGLVYRSEMRAWGWNMRDLECAHWTLPDNSVERNYLTYLREQNLGYTSDLVEYYENIESDYAALGVIKNTNTRNTAWQSSYQAAGLLFMHWHGSSSAKRYSDYHFIKNLFGAAKDGHPYWFGVYYMHFNPDGTGIAQTWADVDRDGQGNAFLPSGEEVPYSLGRGTDNGPIDYPVIGLGAARFAQTVARDRNDSLLLEYSSYVATYVEQAVKYNNPVGESSFANNPKYRTTDFLPLDFEDNALEEVLNTLSEAEWSANIANNTIADVSVQKGDSSFDDYYGVDGKTPPQVTSDNHWAYSSGDIDLRSLEYGFTGGGHDDHLDSSFYLFDFKSLYWRKIDDSAKYVLQEQDPTQPFQVNQSTGDNEYYAWRSEDGSFAPAATHTYGNVHYVPWMRGWYVHGAAVYRSGIGEPGGSVIADVRLGYREDTAWPSGGGYFSGLEGSFAAGVNSSVHSIEDAIDEQNNVRIPVVFHVAEDDGYLMDPLQKIKYGRGAKHQSARPELGTMGCIIPDPEYSGYRAYVAYDTSERVCIAHRLDKFPVVDDEAAWQITSFVNAAPANLNREARWVYLGDHIQGSTKIMIIQPLGDTPGVELYALDAVTFEWSGPYSFTGSLPGWNSQDGIYWRRCIYIPQYDCIAIFYRRNPMTPAVYVMKRPSSLQ